MKRFENKTCRINIKINNKNLFYLGLITQVTEDHIMFIDKKGQEYCFKKKYIEEMNLNGR